MSIFNSIGSNYDLGFALEFLSATRSELNNVKLIRYLEGKYGGKAILTYKGREALRLALRAIPKVEEFKLGINGFTCFAVYEAITKENYGVEYLDIEKNELNFSIESLKKVYKDNPKLKAIIIQNTLGYPCDIESIAKFCRENGIVLIEDLAHSIGTKYKSGQEAGTVGDIVILSFSQDKVIDGVSGGALIIRSDKYNVSNFNYQESNGMQNFKDKLYPLITIIIRKSYELGLGKVLHLILKKFNFLSNPMKYIGQNEIHNLSDAKSAQVYKQYLNLDDSLNHRKKIAKFYSKNIDQKILSKKIINKIDLSSNIRFPIFVERRGELVSYLRKYNIFVSDVWYDAPISPKRYLKYTNYRKGVCPTSETISEKIINLPTHKNVSVKDAKYISDKINIWLKSQQN